MPSRFWPLTRDAVITSPFGPRGGTIHFGVDFGFAGGSAGRPVYAVQAGTVIYAGAAQGYGGPAPAGWLVIDSATEEGSGCVEYGHIIGGVKDGDHVQAGQRIGCINPDRRTNAGVPPHLHLSTMPAGYDPDAKFDPVPWLEDATYPVAAQANTEGEAMTNQLLADVTMLSANDSGPRDPSTCALIIVHTNEGPATGSIEGLLGYLARPDTQASYTIVVGADGRVGRSNDDSYIPWAAGSPANERGLHICLMGYSRQTRAEWLSRPAQLDAAARVVRDWHDRYGIPLIKINGNQMRAGQRGVGGHADTVDAWHSTDHTDPGGGFPWDVLLGKAIGVPSTEDSDMTPDQERMLEVIYQELTKKFPSRSAHRESDEPIDTMAGFVLNADGRAHEMSVDVPAQLDAITRALEELPAKIVAALEAP